MTLLLFAFSNIFLEKVPLSINPVYISLSLFQSLPTQFGRGSPISPDVASSCELLLVLCPFFLKEMVFTLAPIVPAGIMLILPQATSLPSGFTVSKVDYSNWSADHPITHLNISICDVT